MKKTLGKRISEQRKTKGLKQEDLAEKLNISAQAVSKWENDQSCPDISILPELSKILGISIDELLTGEKNVPSVSMLPEALRKDISEMTLKVLIESDEGDTVTVNLPLLLIKSALEIGLDLSQVSSNAALKSIDLEQIMELVAQGVVGNLVEIESSNGDTIRVFVD